MVIDLKTGVLRQEDRVVAALEQLYVDRPVGSIALAKVVDLQNRQILNYLHRAKERGRVHPVHHASNGLIAGWVPGHVPVEATAAEWRATRAAGAVRELCRETGTGAWPAQVGQRLSTSCMTARRWLAAAQRLKLVRFQSGVGWTPVNN